MKFAGVENHVIRQTLAAGVVQRMCRKKLAAGVVTRLAPGVDIKDRSLARLPLTKISWF